MKVNDLIKKLESLRPELREKEIKIECPNGLLVSPEIRFDLEDPYLTPLLENDNVKAVVLNWR